MRLLSGHILPRNASNFTCSHLDLKKFSRGETSTPAYMGREWKRRGVEGVKGFLLLKRGGKKGQERGKLEVTVGEGKGQQRGSCSKLLGEDRRPRGQCL